MGIPVKSILEEKLTKVSLLNGGSHEIYLCEFIDGGAPKKGYYKVLYSENDKTTASQESEDVKKSYSQYPPLLALISVATSSFIRMSHGAKAAEERLVFNKEGVLVGTISFMLNDFIPLNFSNEIAPADKKEYERVIPSTETLAAEKMVETLLLRFAYGDNDIHPHNIGLNGHIDWDMFWYIFTIFIKGERMAVVPPETVPYFTTEDYESFPCIGVHAEKDSFATPNGNYPYHYPTYYHPGHKSIIVQNIPGQEYVLNKVLPKVFPNPQAFKDLAGREDVREQKIAMAIKMLTTFDPELQYERLKAVLGDLPLDYQKLDAKIVQNLEVKFPNLCNKQTDKEPFINFMMGLYQMYYNSLYRTVVLHEGCANNGFGVSMHPTRLALYANPRIYKAIEEWALNENNTTYAEYPEEAKNTKERLQRRYHQIWRDAFAPELKRILADSRILVDTLMQLAGKGLHVGVCKSKMADDKDLTSSMALFGNVPKIEIDPRNLNIAELHPYRNALAGATQFSNALYELIEEYYCVERIHLTEENNVRFIRALAALKENYEKPVCASLSHTTTPAQTFKDIINRMELLSKQIDFKKHLKVDNQVNTIEVLNTRAIDPSELQQQFNIVLFKGVSSLAPELFRALMDKCLKQYQQDSWFATRRVLFTSYLDKTQDSQADQLAFLLVAGKGSTSFNKVLINTYAPYAQKAYSVSTLDMMRHKVFEADDVYISAALEYAKTNPHFEHHCSAQFFKAFYDWVSEPENEGKVKLIKENVKKKYDKGTNNFFNTRYASSFFKETRSKTVDDFFSTYDVASAVAQTFYKGTNVSVFNGLLFDGIMENIQLIITNNPGLLETPHEDKSAGYRVLAKYVKERDKSLMMDLICSHPSTMNLVNNPRFISNSKRDSRTFSMYN